MGEAAELILEGVMCEVCGELVDGDQSGYPRSCEGCE